jgi:hypothetical protein
MQYEENYYVSWAPLVFFLPCFYRYGVHVDDEDLVFGYGLSSPNPALTAKRIPLKELDRASVTTGEATWKDNLFGFGGWGIRIGKVHTGKIGWAYNPENGSYVEVETKDGSAYHFTTRDPEKLKAVLSRD